MGLSSILTPKKQRRVSTSNIEEITKPVRDPSTLELLPTDDLLTQITSIDGTGSGIDADLLDGIHFADIFDYLPIATTVAGGNILGGIKVGAYLTIDPVTGVLNGQAGGSGGGGAWGTITGTLSNQIDLQGRLDLKANLANPTFTGTVILPKTIEIQDTSADNQYILAVSELTSDRTITLPLLTGNDEFVFKDHIQTLTNKTLTSPKINENVELSTTTTKLNYLTDISGTTGNITTKLVFSEDPSFTGTVTISGLRPITLASGVVYQKGESGGWAIEYAFKGSLDTALGGFGAYGTSNVLNNYYIGTYASQKIVILSTGEVGIGTSPASLLHVNANQDANVAIARFFNSGASTAGRYNQLYFGKSAVAGGGGILGYVSDTATPTNGWAYICNYGDAETTQSLIIKKGGNIGIGDSTPSGKLQISTGNLAGGAIGSTWSSNWLVVGETGTTGNGIALGYDSTNGCGIINSAKPATAYRNLSLCSTGGNVGIGTVIPSSKLSINGGLHVGGDSDAGDNNILADGTISAATGATGGFRSTTYSAGQNLIWAFGNATTYGISYQQGGGGGDDIRFHFGNYATPKFTFNQNGTLTAIGDIIAYSA